MAGTVDTGASRAGRAARVRTLSLPRALWRLITGTIQVCFRYRVTGLAAEAGFFALLSLPPLLLGLVGSIGYAADLLGNQVVDQVRGRIIHVAGLLLSAKSVADVIVPTLDDVLRKGRIDLISVGFVLSLWSGSRVLNVFVDTITIMYGLSGRRGIIRTRVLSFSLYLIGLLLGSVTIPLVLVGPELVGDLLPPELDWALLLYWPVVVLLSVVFLTTLYHVAVPVRTPWRWDLPGGFLALAIWIVGSFALRRFLSFSVGGSSTSIYGPLAAPIVVLIWLYMLAIAVLIGAALNATVDEVWPSSATRQARGEGRQVEAEDRPGREEHAHEHGHENPLTPMPPGA
ncbi:MAG TPA: YihY/virulence factor BrkB family protein [Motilibacteraceae bacterium]|nr:YihY/virulence factor BrkB family protein [Motilibacteraceae bacterium]